MTGAPVPLPAHAPAPQGTSPSPTALPAWLLVAMVAAVGLNLRASLGSVPPLLDGIRADFGLSYTTAGLLTAVPVLFMGLAAPLGQRTGARLGGEAATGWFLVLLAVAGLIRLAPAGVWLLFTSTVLAGVAMGGASVLMPAFIAHRLPRVRGLAMGIYSTGLALGVALSAGTSVGLEHLLGGWRPALAAWGGVALATAVAWALLARRIGPDPLGIPTVVAETRLPWRSSTAWMVTAFSSSQMMVGFSGLAWITPLYLELGKSEQGAANLFVLFQVVQLVTMLTLPALTDHTTDRRPLLALVVTSSIAGITLLLIAPLTLAIPAMALFGMGVGGGSTLGLVLIVDSTRTQQAAARLGAMTMLVAFVSGALGPIVLGALSDATGDLRSGYAVMLALSVAVLGVVARLVPGRWIDDGVAARAGGDSIGRSG